MVRFNIEMLAEKEREPVTFMGVEFASRDELDDTIQFAHDNIKSHYKLYCEAPIQIRNERVMDEDYGEESYDYEHRYYWCTECDEDLYSPEEMIEHCRDHIRGDF